MRITVYGAGAVGGQLAARLLRIGVPVSLIARGANLAAIRERGLILFSGTDEWRTHPFCTDDPSQVGVQDVVIVSVKTPSLPSVVTQLAPLLRADTQIVFAMNGVPWWFLDGLPCETSEELRASLDPDGTLRRAIGIQRAVGCSINSGSELVAPGVVRSDTPLRNKIVLGKPDGSKPDILFAFADLTARAGYRTTVTSDIRSEMWPKLMTHSCRPPICGLTNMTTLQLANEPELLVIVAEILKELIALGARLGLSVAFNLDQVLAQKPEGHHVSSFVQDLEAGRPPELTSGILAMRNIARAVGVATPMLNTVSALITARVSSRRLEIIARRREAVSIVSKYG
jgi:2-dehydropantoate 2-reductase